MERSKAEAITAKHRNRLRERYKLPIIVQQRETQRDPADFGFPLWKSRVVLPPPEDDDVLQSLLQMIYCLGDGRETFFKPSLNAVEGEWVGYRRSAVNEGNTAVDTEKAKFESLMGDVSHGLTLLFVHGGAFYLGNPATSRPVVARLAKATGARAFSLRYRLAPQNPFPAALLDLLVAYLSLLYPPARAYHEPVAASSIVLTGESSGANLCFAFLQFLLELGRQQSTTTPSIRFNGKYVSVPLPAGVASVGGWMDLTRSLPSWTLDIEYDLYERGPGPYVHPDFPACSVWPSNSPRGELYCDLSAICHPLVSPTSASDWTGAPPVFICCGEERAADCNMVLAICAKSQGVTVIYKQFEAMPHLFIQLFLNSPLVNKCYDEWAEFCKSCIDSREGQISGEAAVEVETLRERRIDLNSLSVSYDTAFALMKAAKEAGQVWYGPKRVLSVL